MVILDAEQTTTLRKWFLPDRPGPAIGLHLIHSGHGQCRVDRWPEPRVAIVNTGMNYSLAGDPAYLEPAALKEIVGFVEVPLAFRPLLEATFPEAVIWERIIYQLTDSPRPQPCTAAIRPLTPNDLPQLQTISADIAWIYTTWGSAKKMVHRGYAWGAFVNGRLCSIANSFFVGAAYEDIGVVTEAEYRGQGLSAACVQALCADIQQRGRTPSWTTSLDNIASQRVAEKVGFTFERYDRLYVLNTQLPS